MAKCSLNVRVSYLDKVVTTEQEMRAVSYPQYWMENVCNYA